MTSKKQKKPSSNEVRDWSSLPKLPLYIIASKLDAIAHVFFRSTCTAWSTISPRPKLPLIILANHTSLQRRTSVVFFDIDINLLISLPKFSFEFGSIFCGSSHGYLFFLDPASKLYLINPITSHQIRLPKHNAQYRKNKKFRGLHFQVKLALSAPPTDPGCVFAAISRSQNQVDACKVRSISWKTLLSDECHFSDIVFYNGYFYLCSNKALFRLDLEANGGTGMIVNVPLALPVDSDEIDESLYDNFLRETYLVELSGYLHMVRMYVDGEDTYYEILKVDLEKEKLEMVKLGVEDLMFLGISLGIGTNAKRYQGCRSESMFLTKLTNDLEEPGVFCAENPDINCYLEELHGIDQWDTLGWLAPNFSV
ncbi:F-box domain-containing protein [Dioscorea alata]|uniref:F-box domain-containing protein n=1 Tax=Dioscorea alata TaxID=55571 RepID=A0ACB7URK4_DIOAL|nr:F-box domain-containing protein [Dioscorea alata]